MKKLFLATFALLVAAPAMAQEGYERFAPAAHGAGRTYSTMTRGIDAAGLNPALLGLKTKKSLQIAIPGLGLGLEGTSSFQDVGDVADASRNITLDTNRKKLIGLIQDEQFSGRLDLRILGISYQVENLGTFALTYTSHAATRMSIADSLVKANPTTGLSKLGDLEQAITQDPNGISMSDDNTDFQALWYNEIGLHFGTNLMRRMDGDSTKKGLNDLLVGAGIKLVSGLGYAGLEPDHYLRTRPANNGFALQTNYQLRYSYINTFSPKNATAEFDPMDAIGGGAGAGFGFDLGVTAGLFGTENGKNALLVSLALTDIGSITWTENVYFRTAKGVDDTINYSGGKDKVQQALDPVAGALTKESEFTSSLPTMMRVGAALNLAPMLRMSDAYNFVAATELAMGLNDVVGNPKDPRFGLGVHWGMTSGPIAPRIGVGFSTGDNGGLTAALGATLFNTVAIDLGAVFESDDRTDAALAVKLMF